jgi:hypothetical protein
MKFPIDFEQKAALPPAPNGTGYPYKLSAKDLMANFNFAAAQVDPDQDQYEPRLVERQKDGKRYLSARMPPLAGTGGISFVDCDGNEVASIFWVNGVIITNSDQTVEAGCQVVSSSTSEP